MARKPVNQPRSMKPFYIGLAVVAIVGVVIVARQVMGGGGTAAREPVEVMIDPAELSRVQGISIGSPQAPVVIYEFADFQCPGCGTFATFTAPLIKERLVETGQVRFVYYDFPLPQHRHAFLAARAARCANAQDRFWDYHDVLFARQSTWSAMSDAVDYFADLADDIGLDEGSFESCLRSDRYQEEVSRSLRLGQTLGVQSTPSLFVNMKRLQGVPDYRELEQIVRAEMGAAPGADTAAPAVVPTASTPQ